jgi:hypothetical protein
MKLRFGLLASNAGKLEPWLLSQFRPYGLKMLRLHDSGDPDRFERCRTDGEYILCERFSEKLRKIMGRTRGLFSSQSLKGLGGSNPPLSSKQAAIYGILWRTPRNSHVCALYAVVRAPESDRMGPFWAHSADFSPRRGDSGPFPDAGPDFAI